MGGLNGALTQPAETTAAAHAAARIPVRFMMRIVWLVFRPGPFAGTDVQYATDPARPSIALPFRPSRESNRSRDSARRATPQRVWAGVQHPWRRSAAGCPAETTA